MSADPLYPFALPGFGTVGSSTAENPLAASLELMQRTLSSFGQSASMASDSMTQTLNPQELEKRIADLRAVENWLKLNLTMLGSSIQGLEVQLATIQTLRSFAAMGAQSAGASEAQPSPLEVVLGLKKPMQSETAAAPVDTSAVESAQSNMQAAQAWWQMMQNQMMQLAQATSQASQLAQSAAASEPAPKPPVKRARKTTAKAVSPKTTAAKSTKKSL